LQGFSAAGYLFARPMAAEQLIAEREAIAARLQSLRGLSEIPV
jgi:hypothetical protein